MTTHSYRNHTTWTTLLGRSVTRFWDDISWANRRVIELRIDLHRDNAF